MFNIIPIGWIYLYLYIDLYYIHEEFVYNGLWKRGVL